MALLSYSPSTPPVTQQFAPDDRSYRAQATRAARPPKTAWWFDSAGNRQTKVLEGELADATSVSTRNGKLVVNGPWGTREFDSAGTATSGTGTPAADAPPKFSLVPKDPEIDKAASAGLVNTQAKSAQADTLFGKYLAQFEQRSNPAKLDRELKTYETATTDLESSLAKNLAEQRAGLAKARDLDLKALLGNDERYSLMRGPLGAGRSGEQERTFADAYYRAVLPYEQQAAALERANIGDVYSSRLSTAPLGRIAENQYLQLLAEPSGRLLNLGAQEQANLSSAARLLDSNRFTYSTDPRLTGQLPTPVAGYNVPGIPNYGGVSTPVRQPSLMPYAGGSMGYQPPAGTNGSIGQRGSRVSSAEQAYFERTGRWPVRDPQFNPELYEMLGGRIDWGRGNSGPSTVPAAGGTLYPYESGYGPERPEFEPTPMGGFDPTRETAKDYYYRTGAWPVAPDGTTIY